MNKVVEYFTGILFTIDKIEISIFKILCVLIPSIISLYLGRYIIKMMNKKLPKLWELFGKSKFIIELVIKFFIFMGGISIGFSIAGLFHHFLEYFHLFLFKPFFIIGSSPVSIISIFLLVIVIYSSLLIARYAIKILENDIYPNTSLESGIQNILNVFLKYFIIIIGVVIGLQVNGINLSAFATIGAGLMVGIGFGLQNIASNFISGIVILFERPIKVGDYVDVDGIQGFVDQINARSTIIRTRENIQMIVPNSKFISENVVNWSYNDQKILLRIPIGISYFSDPVLAKKILLEIGGQNELVLAEPGPKVLLVEFSNSSIEMMLEVWIRDVQKRYEIKSQINYSIYEKFKENNITIPFPQLDVHMKN